MKHLDEYRDAARVRALAAELRRAASRPWRIMEICGGQTHAILRFGIDQLLPPGLELVHGPGCPVCVTPLELIDRAIELAFRTGVVLASFGDMLRVPGSRTDLLSARARGARVEAVYSPLDAVRLAARLPQQQVVFFAVGFETTAPGVALALRQARAQRIGNFSILSAHVLVPPALRAILGSPDNRIQGVLAAGHVCTVEGYEDYEPIARAGRRADRGDRLRTGGPVARSADCACGSSSRAAPRSRTSIRARCGARATRRRGRWCGRSSSPATASGAASG